MILQKTIVITTIKNCSILVFIFCLQSSLQGMTSISVLPVAKEDAWNGDHYHRHFQTSPQMATARHILELLQCTPEQEILDVGSGTGDLAAYLALSVVPQGRVYGIDASPSMIATAQEHCKNFGNLQFRCADAQAALWDNKQFDHVVCLATLQWIQDQQAVLNNIAKSLKHNGSLLIAMGHREPTLYTPIMATATSSKWVHHFKNPQQRPANNQYEADMKVMLEKASLKPEIVRVWQRKSVFTSKEHFANFMRGWINAIAHVQELAPQLRNDFINDIIQASYQVLAAKPDGSFELENPILIVKAIKA